MKINLKKYSLVFLLNVAFACASPMPEQVIYTIPYFADSIPYPIRNPFINEGIALGKQLFFDKNLSGNGQISCATCHLPDFAFADTMPLTDKGFSKKKLMRNTPTLQNIAWANSGLFWDGGVQDIESLVFAPLRHADEMGQDLKKLPQKLMEMEGYRPLFKKAFLQDTTTNAMIARALAQYVRTLTSSHSRYDDFIQQKIKLTDSETQGLTIFEQKCQSCHLPPFFTDFDFHVVQKEYQTTITDNPLEDFASGRFRITGREADIGKFKTPTLRNLKLTYPYLHDGSAKTIETAISTHETISLSKPEMDLLLIFLATLNE